jgi:hypothetical protein
MITSFWFSTDERKKHAMGFKALRVRGNQF